MYIITRYILRAFVITLLASLAVLTFMMTINVVFQITDMIAKGASLLPILQLLIASIPLAMTMAIPISILVSALLVFGRLSADGEITAMRASGISMWRIAVPPLIIAATLALLCLYINNSLVPMARQAREAAKTRLGQESPIEMLEVGRYIQNDTRDLAIYVGGRDDDFIYNIQIYDLRQKGFRREYLAKKGKVTANKASLRLDIDLFDVRISPAPGLEKKPESVLEAEQWPFSIENLFKRRSGELREKDMPFTMILSRLDTLQKDYAALPESGRARQRMKYLVELNKRAVMSVACIAFVLLGMPLGIKAHRKESSIGIAVSLLLVFGYYVFVILAQSLAAHPSIMPHLIVWIPPIVSISIGTYLLHRAN